MAYASCCRRSGTGADRGADSRADRCTKCCAECVTDRSIYGRADIIAVCSSYCTANDSTN